MNATLPGSIMRRRHERGAVLVISLLLLLVLTLIGLAATRSTTLEERMVANQRDHEVAFQAAEMALRDGESALQNASPGSFSNTAGLYDSTWYASNPNPWQTIDWTASANATTQYEGNLPNMPAGWTYPRYFIVDSGATGTTSGQNLSASAPVSAGSIYYVFAKGWGPSGENSVVLESYFQR